MFKRRFTLATLVAVLVLLIAISFPGVRAAASDFLGLFRVQKFAAISISAGQIAVLEELAESGIYPGEFEMFEEPGEPQLLASMTEAEGAVDWRVRGSDLLGEPDAVYSMSGGSGRLIVNVANARAILEAAGADPALIPDSLDGAAVDATIYPAIAQNWTEGTALVQSPSPLVAYPEDVDIVALGQALLQFLGMEADQARELAESIDWTNTVLLPIPENMATFGDVRVDGEVGLTLSGLDGENAAILWQKDGFVYLLTGSDVTELTDIANSLD
jgi:hypothetical protein